MELIGELNRLQQAQGHLRDEDLRDLSERLRVPLYRIEEVISFYPHFRTTPPPKAEVAVCRDLACYVNGGDEFCARVTKLLANDPEIEVREVSCLGRCEAAPAALIGDVPLGASPEDVAQAARQPGRRRSAGPSAARRDWRIDLYAGSELEPYAVLEAYRDRDEEEAAAEIIERLKASGLAGMGGAAFPAGLKWELVRKEAATPKYVICNADESEPGTFKDRVIMAELPHLVIEGMCLGALVCGADRGWIYIRHEYEPERQALQEAIDAARSAGVLGERFDIEIFVSPGGYILGEETALLEALEDRRGEPRNKPPYPGQSGLWGKPTLINNVETLAMAPAIVQHGPDWWKEQGTRGHHGLKFIGVSGHVERPGVFEIPMGTTVAELIELAGGVKDGRRLKGFAPGGASSNFLPAEAADVEIDFKSIAEAGSMLGSAALIVLDQDADMIAAATNVVRFFRNESCGKCVPCRVGTEKVVAMLEGTLAGDGNGALREALPDLEVTLAETSICGLGQVALNPITSALKYWGDEMEGEGRTAPVRRRVGK
ncbi:MAG: nitroreductase family protein [Gemmatimonadetes bacterium]|uniref:Nitroreductase family protein n=1 Tax=Candidatus Kutchimonas denitrificans TaxID=3056748 RepID=A0AAE4Z9D3_9BACT|nr:nitroreductase family protein [Gemmatimonadota bacterium]NIR74902.1 nitroreductase family protein [Candidatus Kutchimonas denitrificans]NIS00014.1 nitroreductase family protein [Gemmatimonadota bacterium]NIT65597.1 nitroreductase family protein [Gemmatimonadota bacterium]NIU52567.1 nitroreductase family protein [Gemmatimonadota bacterium]